MECKFYAVHAEIILVFIEAHIDTGSIVEIQKNNW